MFSWGSVSRNRPLVVAHRGASRRAPENTLASFGRAIADGADAIELDVRLSADGRAVIIHDRTLFRTTGVKGRVSRTGSTVIRGLSAGAWFHPEYSGEKVPLLEEVLELSGGAVGVNLELKFDSRRQDPAPLVRKVCGIVGEFRRRENVLISSFHHPALELQRAVSPGIQTGILVYPPGVPTTSGVRLAGRLGARWLIYSGGNVRKSFVARARSNGIMTMEYTVDSRMRIRRALAMGLDGVITNDPAGTCAVLVKAEKR